jgi:hypothetical protein
MGRWGDRAMGRKEKNFSSLWKSLPAAGRGGKEGFKG